MFNLRASILKLSFVPNRIRQLLFFRKYKLGLIMQDKMSLSESEWDPLKIFQCCLKNDYAVIILNRPLHWNHDILLRIWENALIKVTVDGGTHRWLHYLETHNIDLLDGKHSQYVPDLITGDMDSCSPEIIEKLKSMGSMIVDTPDQDHSDYTKALFQLKQYTNQKNINLKAIYAFVDSSGRFDHILGNINTLYKSDNLVGEIQVIQVANNSLTWVLKPGFHSISIPNILVQSNSWCGLLPIGSPVNHISTTGLKWNLNNTPMQFGGLVSSSNTYDSCSKVTINTDSLVVWTMGIEPLKENVNYYRISLSNTN